MKIKLVLTFCFLSSFINTFSQNWTKSQLELANTAKNNSILTQTEKDAILYINLCRLFPKEFARKEIAEYKWPIEYGDSAIKIFETYKKSLMSELSKKPKSKALQFDKTLYLDAKCYANEISKVDRNGHDRVNCKESNYAECISFGKETGRAIAIELIIDYAIESLGHRKICLDKNYKKIGLCSTNHFTWEFCAVLEFE